MMPFMVAAAVLLGTQSAVDIYAPIAPKPPTIASEIQRGIDAELRCETTTDSAVPEEYFNCVQLASARNRQILGQNYEAFDCGLYYRARITGRGVVRVFTNVLGPNHAITGLAVSQLAIYEGNYTSARDKLHLTDSQVIGAR